MHRLRRRLKSFVWLALLAFVGLAVAPTVSRAIHLGGAGAGVATASGHAPMTAMAHHHHGHDHGPDHQGGSTDSPARPAEHEHALEHCAMCVVAASAFALAMTAPALSAPCSVGDAILAPPCSAPACRDHWSPATSRGPPVLA